MALSGQQGSTTRRPILVTGAHRTGTTWVGKMLALSSKTAYISEPLNVLHRPGVFDAPVNRWYTYICSDNEAHFFPAYQKLLHLKYDPVKEIPAIHSRKDVMRMARDASIFWGGRLRRARPLIKDPFAVFSLGWFVHRLDCQVVVTVRHPAAFVSSLKRLDWRFDLDDLLQQPLLLRDWLEPYRSEMDIVARNPEDIISQAGLLWRIVYAIVDEYRRMVPQIQVVRHEDLSIDPLEGYEALYKHLGLEITPEIKEKIVKASSAENPQELSAKSVHAVRLDSKANLANWKRRLTAEELHHIRLQTEEIASLYYSDLDWEK
jgi:hypothetical protein